MYFNRYGAADNRNARSSIASHKPTWLALHDDSQGHHIPALTEREFRRYPLVAL